MKKTIFLAIAVLTTGCQANPNDSDTDQLVSGAEASAEAAAEEALESAASSSGGSLANGWRYSEKKDEMRGELSKYARKAAEEPITLPWPYGQTTPELVVRQDAKYGFDILISADGQFLCRQYSGDTVSVKFDEGPIKKWQCADADGGSSDVIFIIRGKAFLNEIKKSQKMIVEADMYQAGRVQMKFSTAGLNWD